MYQRERDPTARSQEGEKCRTLHRDQDSRLRIGSNGQGTTVIELVIDMLPRCPRIDLEMMYLKLKVIEDLRGRGYELACDHDSFICAEMEVDEERLDAEITTLMEIISRLKG